jgi:phage regulator Rha-like protein
MKELIPQERIERRIFVIRGQKIMLSVHLAELYGVETKVLVQAVKRNIERFPEDFMFQLTWEEAASLRSQFVTLENSNKAIPRSQIVTLESGQNIKYLPYAFTEHGILMLSSVLNSERAIQVNIAIMRAFVRLKQVLATHKELAEKLKELEGEVGKHNKLIIEIFEIIKQLTPPILPIKPKPPIGFIKLDD